MNHKKRLESDAPQTNIVPLSVYKIVEIIHTAICNLHLVVTQNSIYMLLLYDAAHRNYKAVV